MCLLGIQGDDGIQRRIVCSNLCQMRFQHFCGGNMAGPDGGSQLRRTGENHFHHDCLPGMNGLLTSDSRRGRPQSTSGFLGFTGRAK